MTETRETLCPTCGSPVLHHESDEGTHSFEPIDVVAERQQAIDALHWIQQFAAKTVEVGVDGVVNPGFVHVERAARDTLVRLGEKT